MESSPSLDDPTALSCITATLQLLSHASVFRTLIRKTVREQQSSPSLFSQSFISSSVVVNKMNVNQLRRGDQLVKVEQEEANEASRENRFNTLLRRLTRTNTIGESCAARLDRFFQLMEECKMDRNAGSGSSIGVRLNW